MVDVEKDCVGLSAHSAKRLIMQVCRAACKERERERIKGSRVNIWLKMMTREERQRQGEQDA